MARSPGAKHNCPLFNRIINWSMCYEVQDVRDDNMDMELFPEPFDVKMADKVCEKCRWFYVGKDE